MSLLQMEEIRSLSVWFMQLSSAGFYIFRFILVQIGSTWAQTGFTIAQIYINKVSVKGFLFLSLTMVSLHLCLWLCLCLCLWYQEKCNFSLCFSCLCLCHCLCLCIQKHNFLLELGFRIRGWIFENVKSSTTTTLVKCRSARVCPSA